MGTLEIITTSDGSHTIRNRELNETYHSIHGAVQESMHVFIKNGLEYFQTTSGKQSVSLLEVGLGTGLNAWLTSQFAAKYSISVNYTSLEPFPLGKDVWSCLNYGGPGRRDFELIHDVSWEVPVKVSPHFTILKRRVELQAVDLNSKYDVVYFDAFAPSVQPELWELQTLRRVTERIWREGVFVTYSAKGQLKRDLRQLGGNVETLPGPPGKKEMVRATFT